MGSDSSKPEPKETSSKFVQSISILEKLAAMNAMKTDSGLRQDSLVIIITMDTICNSVERAYFDRVINYKKCAHDHREGSVVI